MTPAQPPRRDARPDTRTVASAALATDRHPELEALLARVESALGGLGEALRQRDTPAIEAQAQLLQGGLEDTVNAFARAARAGSIPAPLRARLVKASGQVAAQRDSLMRATAALDRAIDTLMPKEPGSPAAPVYGGRGWGGAGSYRG
jgi:hypothetical protein